MPATSRSWFGRFWDGFTSLFREPAKPTAPTKPPVTPSQGRKQPADVPIGRPGNNEEDRLDEALEETMPGSDPISLTIE